jgi:hypothetical protein
MSALGRGFVAAVVCAAALGLASRSEAAVITVVNAVSPSPVAVGGDFTGHDGFAGFPGIYTQPAFSAAGALVGQTVGLTGLFEVVSGTPTGPLTLVVPASADGVTRFESELQGQTGTCGNDCTGEGAVTFLFAAPQASIGLDVRKTNGGTLLLQFFEPDGTPFDVVTIASLVDGSRTFQAQAGSVIGAVTITNIEDAAGVSYDDLRLTPGSVPTPAPGGLGLLAIGFAALSLVRLRRGSR